MSSSGYPETNLITLSRHVLYEQMKHEDATGSLTLLLVSIQLGCKFVSSQVRRAGLANLTGLAGHTNVQGEEVKKLDVISNDIFINSLVSSGQVALMVSEENEEAILVTDPLLRGGYAVVFDPLDGSSNIDSGVGVGTIFGIYSVNNFPVDSSAVLRPGREMVAAGYALYGSFTTLVLSTGRGVNGYTLDPMTVPRKGSIYSVNEGNSVYWDPTVKAYFDRIKGKSDHKSPYTARYVGSMVADVHRTLLHGGIFAYPADTKSPTGKLRLLYECNPMAFIFEQAGGAAIRADGTGQRILDVQPTGIHQRCPIVLGSAEDVAEYKTVVGS